MMAKLALQKAGLLSNSDDKDLGYFLYNLDDLIKIIDIEKIAYGKNGFVEKSVNQLKEKYHLEDIFFERRVIKIGVSKNMKLLEGNNSVELSNVSAIVRELDFARRLFPLFFVYYKSEIITSNIGVKEINKEMRQNLGRYLWVNFASMLNEIDIIH